MGQTNIPKLMGFSKRSSKGKVHNNIHNNKKKEIFALATTWIKREGIRLSEIEKNTCNWDLKKKFEPSKTDIISQM